MKRVSAIAHFRQLCCLGLSSEAVVPSLLSALHGIVSSEVNGFHWADSNGRMVGFVPEYVLPEVIAALVDHFDGMVERSFQLDFASTMRRGRPLGNLVPAQTASFYRGDLFHLIYRPYKLHHVIDLVVRDTPNDIGRGALIVGRSMQEPPFSGTERNCLLQLLPYIAHALHGGARRADNAPRSSEPDNEEFASSGSDGLVILDLNGCVAYSSARARHILYYAADEITGDASKRGPASAGTPLRTVFDSLLRVAAARAGPPPVVHRSNRWGRFVFRAHWLDAGAIDAGGFVGVTVQQQEPLVLVMMRNMHDAGLSAMQKNVCLLMAQNHSFESIAKQLHISHSTAKDYAARIYRKLNVHTRDELLHKLR